MTNEQAPPITEPVLVLVGPTAIGKTTLSLAIATQFSCEIIGLDSMQIYRHMDIGTAKPTTAERAIVPHHLIDIVDPSEEYNVARYVEEALSACRDVISRGNTPLLVGGTGLYLKGLLSGLFEMPRIEQPLRQELRHRLEKEGRGVLFAELECCDPDSARRIHPNDTQRLLRALEIFQQTGRSWSDLLCSQRHQPAFTRILRIGLRCNREILYQRINQRVEHMMTDGLLDEVEHLLAIGYGSELAPMQAIGYRHMINLLQGKWSREEALELLARDTRRYAKRQMTWFSADREINWFANDNQHPVLECINTFLAHHNQEGTH